MTTNNPLVFMGTPDFAAGVLSGILAAGIVPLVVISMPDRPQGRGYQLVPTPVKQVAAANHIACYQPENAKALQAILQELPAFLGLVVAYGMILPESMVRQFDLVNLHASLLPRYRGASPIQATLLNGDKQTGMSLMRIDKDVDAGDVIAQKTINIDANEHSESLTHKLIAASIALFVAQYQTVQAPWSGQPQDQALAMFTKKIKREDGAVDLVHDSAQALYRKWQAYTPWPGIFVFHNGKRVKLIEITLREGKLVINKVQVEGKSIVDYVQFMNGNGALPTPD